MNCSRCGYSMTGLAAGSLCPECGCTLPPVPLDMLRAAERRSQIEAAIFVAALAVIHVALLDNFSPLLLLPLWIFQLIAAAFVAVYVVTASCRRRFWTSRWAKTVAGVGVCAALMLAPFALGSVLFVGWVAVR